MFKKINHLSIEFLAFQNAIYLKSEQQITCLKIIDNFGNEIIDFLDGNLLSRNNNSFMLQLLFTNPSQVDFNSKLYLLSKEILAKQQTKCASEGLNSNEIKLCLVFKLLSFVFYSKKMAWANRAVQVILNNVVDEIDHVEKECIIMVRNQKDLIHRLTSILSGIFKLETTNLKIQISQTFRVFNAITEHLKISESTNLIN